MAKERSDRRKRRTRAHVIADLAINHVERHMLLCGHTMLRITYDYGLDVAVTTYSRVGEVENGVFWMQIKATDHPQGSKGRPDIAVRVERKHLLSWLGENYPVILVLYDAKEDRAYWLDVQLEFGNGRIFQMDRAGDTLTLHVPQTQVVGQEAVHQFRKRKRDAVRQWRRGGPTHA